MNDLRILFMGTPDFAVATLKSILNNNYKVVGVITAPDRPAGRGRKLKASAVKEFALAQNLKVLQPTNLKDESFIKELEKLQVNLNIVVAFRMLPKVVWAMPVYGTFNLHASLLPNYRGAAPINWAIINGETTTGNTTFFIDEKIDTGHIILQEEVEITVQDSAGSLHDKLMEQGAALVIKTIQTIENGQVSTTIQPDIKNLKTAYKLTKENTRINWNQDIKTIHNLIRGLCPYPTAWSILNNKQQQLTVKIYESEIEEKVHKHTNGLILIEDLSLKVAAKNGYVVIRKIQLPGKKAMNVEALLNGYQFDDNAKMS